MSCSPEEKSYCKPGHRAQFMAVIVPDAGQGYISPPAHSAFFVPLLSRDARYDCGNGRACSWWWITIHPKTILRRSDDPPEDFSPLPESEIDNNGCSCSSLKVRLTLSDNTNKQRVIIADVGPGISLAWYGPSVQIDVLTWDSRGAAEREVRQVGNGFDGFTAFVVEDVIIEANAVAVECCPDSGVLPLLFTDVQRVGGVNRTVVFDRPAGAHRVAYYTTSGSPDIVAFVAIPGLPYDPASEIARIFPSPTLANPRVGYPFDVPGAACALVCDNSSTGQYTAVWEIEP